MIFSILFLIHSGGAFNGGLELQVDIHEGSIIELLSEHESN